MISNTGKSRIISISLLLMALLRFSLFEIAPKCIPAGILMISSCADERPPTGGRRDSLPPKVKYADPANKSLNFHSKKIKIRFSEFIQQTLDPKEILISPPIDKKPKMMVNGKNLTITLKSPLKENTTYTINFGDAIKDLNEGNTFKNFTYVFATGSILDTASVSGTVTNASDPKDLDNLIVALYPADSIDGILHSKPFYFAKSDKLGNFVINNIHAGTYRAYALRDQNLNYLYDQADELIGFMDSTVTLTDSSTGKINLSVFLSANSSPKFTDAVSTGPGKIIVSYNSGIKTLKLNSDPSPRKEIAEINERKDSITYWHSNIYDKKLTLFLVANDSIIDTARIDLKSFNKDSTNNNKKYTLSFESPSIKTDSIGKQIYNKPILSPFKPLILKFSRPVDSIDQNKRIYITKDSTSKVHSLALTSDSPFSLDPAGRRKITIEYKQTEKTAYTLTIPDSTFLDIFGWWNKKFYYKWNSDANENYGNMILNIKFEHPERNYVFKLLDADNKVAEKFSSAGNEIQKMTFKNIKAGIYHLQVIDDDNNNGEWDSGDFHKKIQPEKIINFRETYDLKGSWDLEVEVKL